MIFKVAMLFGGAQIVVTMLAIMLANKGKRMFALLFTLIKFAAYAKCITVLYKNYNPHIFRFTMGYIAGIPIFAFLSLIVYIVLKKIVIKKFF